MMEATITSAFQTIVKQILTKISLYKERISFVGTDAEMFNPDIWFLDPSSNYIEDFMSIYTIDKNTAFIIIFGKITSFVASLLNSRVINEMSTIELIAYNALLKNVSGNVFRLSEESTFNKFLDDATKLAIQFPHKVNLIQTLANIANSFINNGAIPVVRSLSSITNVKEFIDACYFFLRIEKAIEITFEAMSGFHRQLSTENRMIYYEILKTTFPSFYSKSKLLQTSPYLVRSHELLNIFWSIKPIREEEPSEFIILLASLSLGLKDSCEAITQINKKMLEIKKLMKRSPKANDGFNHIIGSLVIRGQCQCIKEINSLRANFESNYIDKKNKLKILSIMDTLVPKYLAYDIIDSKGRSTPFQEYIGFILGENPDPVVILQAVQFAFKDNIFGLSDLSENMLNLFFSALSYPKLPLAQYCEFFFTTFSTYNAMNMLAVHEGAPAKFFDILNKTATNLNHLPLFSVYYTKCLHCLFTQSVLVPDQLYVLELFVHIDLFIQRLIISCDPNIAYMPSLILEFILWSNSINIKKDAFASIGKDILNITMILDIIFGTNTANTVKNLLGIEINPAENDELRTSIIIKCLRMWLDIVHHATNGKCLTPLNFKTPARFDVLMDAPLVEYIFVNSSLIFNHKRLDIIDRPPIRLFFESLFLLFNHGHGGMTPIIEKSRFVDKIAAPTLIEAALDSLKSTRFDNTNLQAKKNWSQTLKLLGIALSNKDTHTYAGSQLEQFVVVILQDLQLSDGALELDHIKQPILSLIQSLYDNSPKVNTVKRMFIADVLVNMIEADINNEKAKNLTNSVTKCLRVLEKVFTGFVINPSDSNMYGQVSDFDTLSYSLEMISHFFAILVDCLVTEMENDNDIRSAFLDFIYAVFVPNVHNLYPIYMYYARINDSTVTRAFKYCLMKYCENHNDLKDAYYIGKLSNNNYEIFKNPPINCVAFYMAAIKHAIASLKSDIIFMMMTDELAKSKDIEDPIFVNFFSVWFFICATPSIVEQSLKAISQHKSMFPVFIPHGSFPFHLKELSQKTGFTVSEIFDKLFIGPILKNPLPFGLSLLDVASVDIIAQMSSYFNVIENVVVSYFAPPFPALAEEIKMLRHFLDENPVSWPDVENYSRTDTNYLNMYNSKFIVSVDKDIKRHKYWLLTTKNIPRDVMYSEIIQFVRETINQKSVLILDAEVDSPILTDNFDRFIDELGDQIESMQMMRVGIGVTSKIASVRNQKFDFVLQNETQSQVILPMQLSIPELSIPGECSGLSDFKVIMFSNHFAFYANENFMGVYSAINYQDITDLSVNRNILHVHTAYRDLRFQMPIAVKLSHMIDSYNKDLKRLNLPRSDLNTDPIFELLAIAMTMVSSTEAEVSTQSISLFHASLRVLTGDAPFKDAKIQTSPGFAIPHKNFSDLLGEYKDDVAAIMSQSKLQTQTSAIMSTIADTLNSEKVPRTMLAIMAQSLIKIYTIDESAQAAAKLFIWTKINSEKFIHIAVPLIANYCETKQFADLINCLLRRCPEAIYEALFTSLIKNEISAMPFYKFVMKPSCYGIIYGIAVKSSDLFVKREATSLYIMAIGLTMGSSDQLWIYQDFFKQYIAYKGFDDLKDEFDGTDKTPKEYLRIINKTAARSDEFEIYNKYIDITAHSGYMDTIVDSNQLTELQCIDLIKRAYQSKNQRRLIFIIEMITEYIKSYKKCNVQPLFLIWALFPLLQSNNTEIKPAILEMISAIFDFTHDVMQYPSILDIASSINQSDLMINAMDSFYELLFSSFEDANTDFEAYFGIALAAHLVGPLADKRVKQEAMVLLNQCLQGVTQQNDFVYFVVIAAALTDIDLSPYLQDQSFSDFICQGADLRTPYEALFIAQSLFLGLMTRQDKHDFFTNALLSFFKIRTEIPQLTSKYMLNILSPILDNNSEDDTRVKNLSKLIAIAMTALPFTDSGFKDLNNPSAPNLDDNDTGFHFEDITVGVEDCIKTSYVSEP